MFNKQDYKKFNMTPEILASEHFVSFTGTLSGTGVTADDEGRKIVPAGSLVDEDGALVTVEENALSGDPIGVLLDDVEVTYGDQPAPLLVEGYVYGERLKLGEDVETTAANLALVTAALPEVKLR